MKHKVLANTSQLREWAPNSSYQMVATAANQLLLNTRLGPYNKLNFQLDNIIREGAHLHKWFGSNTN